MTGKLLLASATTAAALVSAAPAVTHGSPARAQRDVLSARGGSVTLVAPKAARLLSAELSGSRALAAQAHMVVVRTSDGATLFTGSLATFRGLRIEPGTQVRVEVAPAAGRGGASAALRWS